jgi:hypothetical protein
MIVAENVTRAFRPVGGAGAEPAPALRGCGAAPALTGASVVG